METCVIKNYNVEVCNPFHRKMCIENQATIILKEQKSSSNIAFNMHGHFKEKVIIFIH